MGLLNDKAVEGDSKSKIKDFDKLGLADYADALATFIKGAETPITIGIQGDWGIGKTSLLNMIDKSLDDSKFKTIWFNTWHFSLFDQDELLGIAVIRALLDKIAEEFDLKEENKSFDKAKKILFDVTKELSIHGLAVGKLITGTAGDSSDIENINISLQMLEFKSEFENLIDEILDKDSEGNFDTKIVLIIDDLDRVRPLKAIELLESLKNFLDVEGCVFLIAVDYEIVQLGMAEKFGKDIQKTSGKSFFDKIIQVPFLMPTSTYRLGDYIGYLLSKSGYLGSGNRAKLKEELKPFYEEITSVTVGRNPRSIKRVINYAKLLDTVRARNSQKGYTEIANYDVQKQILYALNCMQIAWPELFNYFVKKPTAETIKDFENWEFLENLPEAKKLFERVHDQEVVKNNISAFFDILFDLLDKDNSGHIDRDEIEPVRLMLDLAKLTSVSDVDEPIDKFLQRVRKNDVENKFERFMNNIFRKSKWFNDSNIDYRMTGKRYVTILINRKQVGSLVTLVSNPFIFRLALNENKAINKIKTEFGDIDIESVIQPLENTSLSGFGDTLVKVDNIFDLDDQLAIKFLNILFDIIEGN